MSTPLILASGSATRQAMLSAAGVPFTAVRPLVDEEGYKKSLAAEGATALDAAIVLAEVKATQVSRKYPGALVLGADQMLECEGTWFDKADDTDGVRAALRALRGKTHALISGAVIVLDGKRIWHSHDRATLEMRLFSDDFLEWYIAETGAMAFQSVGAYQIEGLGQQLFTTVHGHHSTILGLPLLPLLAFLRTWGVIQS